MDAVLDPRFSALLTSLYGGIDAPRPWENFLKALSAWLDSSFATLIIASEGTRLPGTFVTPNADPARSAQYIETFFANDPFRSLPEGQVTSFAEFLSNHEPGRFAAYRQYLAQAGGEEVLAVDLRFPGRFEARFRITRGPEQSPFKAEDRLRLQDLVPHLRIAVALFEKLQFALAEHAVLASATGGLGLGLLVIDRQSQLVSSNPLADRLLAEAEGIRCSGNTVRLDSPELRKRIADLLGGGSDQGVARFRIARAEHGDLVVTARAIDLPAIHSGTGALALFLTRPGWETLVEPETIRELLGITRAEARLCAVLAQGHSLVEAATRLGITRNTAKVQLRSIFAKTQVHRQSQLVGLLSGLPG